MAFTGFAFLFLAGGVLILFSPRFSQHPGGCFTTGLMSYDWTKAGKSTGTVAVNFSSLLQIGRAGLGKNRSG